MERTLLLVDDEENISAALTRLLRRDGYKILRANSGREGLALLETHEVGVIVSDQRMPEMSGVEFLSHVRDLYPDTVRIVLSGYTELNSITDAINRGAIYKFLTKPWDDDLLRNNVQEAFKYFEMTRENERLSRELKQANDALSTVNNELEQRVADKTHEIQQSLQVLRVSQEILESLPFAVVGFGDDGVIAVANRAAHQWIGEATADLVGELAAACLPNALLATTSEGVCTAPMTAAMVDGRTVQFWRYGIGPYSGAQGTVIVIGRSIP